MSIRSLNVSEARRELSRLIDRVSRGGAPVTIGARGRPAAVLVAAEEYEALRRKAESAAAPAGWDALRLQLVGSQDELDADLRQIRASVDPALPTPRRKASSHLR